MRDVTLIGLSGFSGSGKSSYGQALVDYLGPDCAYMIPMDNYYKDQSHLSHAERAKTNFDHPDSMDLALFKQHLAALKAGKTVARPTYDFSVHNRTAETVALSPKPVIIVDGIFAFCNPEIRDLFDCKVYVDTPDGICITRRAVRDTNERGRTIESVQQQYESTVRPMSFEHVLPQKEYADIVIANTQQDFVMTPILPLIQQINQFTILPDRYKSDANINNPLQQLVRHKTSVAEKQVYLCVLTDIDKTLTAQIDIPEGIHLNIIDPDKYVALPNPEACSIIFLLPPLTQQEAPLSDNMQRLLARLHSPEAPSSHYYVKQDETCASEINSIIKAINQQLLHLKFEQKQSLLKYALGHFWQQAVAMCPSLSPYQLHKALRITPVSSSFTNESLSCRLEFANNDDLTTPREFFVRVTQPDNTGKLSPDTEEQLLIELGKANLAPPVYYYDPQTKKYVTPYASQQQPLTIEGFHQDGKQLQKICATLTKVHAMQPQQDCHLDMSSQVPAVLNALSKSHNNLPADFHALVTVLGVLIENFSAKTSNKLCFSHNNLAPHRILYNDQDELVFTSWEYAGYNSCFWDLAMISVQFSFNKDQDAELLTRYFDEPCSIDNLQALTEMKVIVEAWLGLFAKYHSTLSTTKSDSQYHEAKYAMHVQNCRKRLAVSEGVQSVSSWFKARAKSEVEPVDQTVDLGL